METALYSSPERGSVMAQSGKRSTVHVMGQYMPVATGLEALEEIYYFRRVFLKANLASGAESAFLMGQKGDPTISLKYVKEKVVAQDVVVLLNPTGDVHAWTYRAKYKEILRTLVVAVGRSRIVIAFQDREIKRIMASAQASLWEITYSPITEWRDEKEVQIFPEPQPEEAVGIVKKILLGGNPDIYSAS